MEQKHKCYHGTWRMTEKELIGYEENGKTKYFFPESGQAGRSCAGDQRFSAAHL